MNITIRSKNIDNKNFFYTYGFQSWFQEVAKKLYEWETEILHPTLVIEKRKDSYYISFSLQYHDKKIKISKKNEDIYRGISLVIYDARKEIIHYSRVLQRNKEKQHTSSIREEANERQIIKRKMFDLKPMYEEEAIAQMEVLGHDSFLFLNARNQKISLLYKRKNNGYGCIEANGLS